jgi:cell wall-associated NlpC family hydrolase
MGAMVIIALLLAGCTSTPREPLQPSARTPAAQAANAVLMRAIGLVGTPYRYGGNTPQGGFDCSGLVGFVFADAAGLALPRSTGEIARMPAANVSRERLAAGDLVLFADAGQVSHIGIYVGDARFVHAPSAGGTVRLDPIDAPYWQRRFIGGRRLLR